MSPLVRTEAERHPPRLRPAWLGIVGWLLVAASLVLSLTAPWPYNGQSLAAVLLGAVGTALVAVQVRRIEAKGRQL